MLGIYLMQFFGATGPSLTALVARNTGGSTKKSVSYAIVYTGWAVGNAVAPLLFTEQGAPRYTGTLKFHLGLYLIWVAVAFGLRGVLIRRQKEKEEEQSGGEREGEGQRVRGDLTDRLDPGFKYSF